MAKGEFITFLDSDDLLKKEIFDFFINSLRKYKGKSFSLILTISMRIFKLKTKIYSKKFLYNRRFSYIKLY